MINAFALKGSLILNKVNVMFRRMVTHITVCQSKATPGQLKWQQDRSRMVPSSTPSYFCPQADLGAVFTLLITGEGLADRRAITDSPQAWGWEHYKHPLLSPKCDGSVQLSWGSLHGQKKKGPKKDIKDMRGIGRVGSNRGYT